MTLRILVFPGFKQNATVSHRKLAAIQKACGRSVEFVFLDPPHVIQPMTIKEGNSRVSSASASAYDSIDSPGLQQRTWWFWNKDETMYIRHLEAIHYVRDFLAKTEVPFHGVLGFSQGAAMAALVTIFLERPEVFPNFLVDGKPSHPPLRFCVFISGFRITDAGLSYIFSGDIKYSTPSLHVLGRKDTVVSPTLSRTLIDVFESPCVELHDGGHIIPSTAAWLQFFKSYFASYEEDSHVRPADVRSPTLPKAQGPHGEVADVGREPPVPVSSRL